MQVVYLNPLLLFPALAMFCLIYYLFPRRLRWTLLLVASYAFLFLLGRWTVLILLASTLLNYSAGRLLGSAKLARKKLILISAVVLNIGLLVFFKYFVGFFNPESALYQLLSSDAGAILFPVGLSFYTLQNISYLLDVSVGTIAAEKNLGLFSTYLAFFPKLTSGPVERGGNLLPQLRSPDKLTTSNIGIGCRSILIGLFFKLVIADRLALFVNEVFAKPGTYQGVTLIVGLIFLSFQIYLDFAGYTRIAIGTAKLLGINLVENFDRPYLSVNLIEFWNRWHISFSSWLRDYIFYPLRYKLLHIKAIRSGLISMVVPPLITMFVSGLWHGTGLTYLLWGLYHAFFYIAAVLLNDQLWKKVKHSGGWVRGMRILMNFGVLTGGWLLFRADSMQTAFTIFSNIFVKSTTLELILQSTYYVDYLLSVILIVVILLAEILREWKPEKFSLAKLPFAVRWAIYLLMAVAITLLGVYQAGGSAFSYGQV